jgi:3-oxoacyl-[acyl-carrier protein] reductase
MRIDFADQVVLVTGGARGIGVAIVRRLATSGARIVLHYSRSRAQADQLALEFGSERCAIVQADLTTQEGAEQLWAQAVERYGRINALISNAALVTPLTIDDSTEVWRRIWAETLQVNVQSVANLCRVAIVHYRMHGGGIIINIASRAAFRGDDPHLMHYAASKGAVVALTRSIARGYAADNILAYVVAPGFVRTERQEGVIRQRGEAAMTRDIPLGEMASPDDIANVVAFFASGLARHATGATIDINGASYFH